MEGNKDKKGREGIKYQRIREGGKLIFRRGCILFSDQNTAFTKRKVVLVNTTS
jgi:hypothetical protein